MAPAKKDPPQIDGILIHLVPSETGRAMNIEALGKVSLTELPTLLRLAARETEEQLGI